jgi:WD40 repeat protein
MGETMFITGGTDGHLALWTTSADGSLEQISCAGIQKVHQNSIKSLCTGSLTEETSLVLTSGDDNALGLTLVFMRDKSVEPLVSTLIIPHAHAAAINTAKLLWMRPIYGFKSRFEIRVGSASNDQRVKIWDVVMDLSKPGVEGMDVRKTSNQYSAVADISSMGIFPAAGDEENAQKILICGVGMEVWKVGQS